MAEGAAEEVVVVDGGKAPAGAAVQAGDRVEGENVVGEDPPRVDGVAAGDGISRSILSLLCGSFQKLHP